MTEGSGTRVDPLVVAITTAGFDLESPCGELYERGKRVAAGEEDDPTYGLFWWEAPEGCSKWDEDGWRAANPNIAEGLLDIEDMRARARQARESAFRRFRLNQWSRGDESWVTPEQWAACYGEEELDWEKPFVVALDFAIKHDTAALLVCQPHAATLPDEDEEYEEEADEDGLDEDGIAVENYAAIRATEKVVVRGWFWKPKAGKPIDDFEVEETIRDLWALGTCVEVGYDPALFRRSAEILLDEGVNMVEFPQQSARMVPACHDAYAMVDRGKIRHGGQPTLTDHVLNAQARNAGEGWRLSKAKATRKIDGAVALVIGVKLAIHMVESAAPEDQVW